MKSTFIFAVLVLFASFHLAWAADFIPPLPPTQHIAKLKLTEPLVLEWASDSVYAKIGKRLVRQIVENKVKYLTSQDVRLAWCNQVDGRIQERVVFPANTTYQEILEKVSELRKESLIDVGWGYWMSPSRDEVKQVQALAKNWSFHLDEQERDLMEALLPYDNIDFIGIRPTSRHFIEVLNQYLRKTQEKYQNLRESGSNFNVVLQKKLGAPKVQPISCYGTWHYGQLFVAFSALANLEWEIDPEDQRIIFYVPPSVK